MSDLPAAVLTLEELLTSPALLSRIVLADAPPEAEARDEAARRHLGAAYAGLALARAVARRAAAGDADAVARLRPRDVRFAFRGEEEDDDDDDDDDGRWILLDAALAEAPALAVGDERGGSDATAALRHLGRLLGALFTGRAALTEAAPIERATSPETVAADEEPEEGSRRARRARHADEDGVADAAGDVPVAVGRLLADMAADGAARSMSFDDIVQELEQMTNYPDIFLFDQSHEFYSAHLNFGQRCYGREKDLARLLAISTKFESAASPSPRDAAVVAFVSGIAGAGKSHFVQSVTTFLAGFGWTVVRAKFRRAMGHASRDVVASLFGKLVARLAAPQGGEEDAAADAGGRRAARAIAGALDRDGLACLAQFVPALRKVVPGIERGSSLRAEAEMSHWQLVFLLSELMGAILSLERNILICLDDLQWSDSTTLSLIKEVIMSVGQDQQGRRHFLFVGMYREEEISQSHPLAEQLAALKNSSIVAVTEIKLSNLSTEDISDMIMSEMRLPRRLVWGLADEVQRKTSGHAIFVVQLLDSLVREGLIAYSPRKRRFDWDESKVASLRTWDSVASLIVSSLSCTKPKDLQNLRILSCLGIQSSMSLIKLIDTSSIVPPGGIQGSLNGLLERGILKMLGQAVVFSHDLIQQHLYESTPADKRKQMHLDIGLFLGSKTTLDTSSDKLSLEGGLGSLYFSDGSSRSDKSIQESTLILIAADQINAAGPTFVRDGVQLTRFAGWFLQAAKEAAEHSNFQAALFNYKNGIAFLINGLWLGDSTHQLCLELHEGAAFASFALGNSADVEVYARAVIEHVPLEDSLVAHAYRIRSLKGAGKYAESIATGLAVLRQLSIDIPSVENPMTIVEEMTKTRRVTSQYTIEQIVANMKQTSNVVQNVLKIVDTVIVACYREASPYLPLVACAMINYSFQNGICEESAAAFAVNGFFEIFLREDFEEGRRWGNVALKIMGANSAFIPLVLHGFLLFWFDPHQEIATKLLGTYEMGMKIGDVDNAMYALTMSMRFSLFGGMNLSILSQAYLKHLKQIAKYNTECWEYTYVDLLMVEALTGVKNHPFLDYVGMIQDEDILLAHCKHKQHNQGIEQIYTRRFLSAFWAREYTEARKWLELASALPSSKMPKIQLIHRTFFSALLAFRRYRQGDGEDCLKNGENALEKMRLWSNHCSKVFENKLLLLESEHYACLCNIVAAKESYVLSSESARDHGLVNEQGLAFELYGDFLLSVGDLVASEMYQQAINCYVQWGALAKVDQLRKEFNLDSIEGFESSIASSLSSSKRDRVEDKEFKAPKTGRDKI